MIRQSLIFNKPLSWHSVILTLAFIELSKDRLFKRNDFGILEQNSLTSLVYSVYRYGQLLLRIRRDVRVELCLQVGLNKSEEITNRCNVFSSHRRAGCKCCDSSLT